MQSLSKLLWNLFRLCLALGFFGLVVAGVVYIFRGEFQVVAGISALMSVVFFSINVTNFVQYRWAEADVGARVVVVAPVVLSAVAVAVAASAVAPVGFGAVGVVIVFWVMVTRRRPDLRFSRVPVRLELDDEQVRLKYAHVVMESVGWDEIVRVAAAPEADGPIDDDLFFFLEDDQGEGTIIPNTYARQLLDRLQRLEGFDNEALVEAATGGVEEPKVLWEGPPGRARICGDSGGDS